MKKDKYEQQRKTLEDTLKAQGKLRELVISLRDNNRPLNEMELKDFYKLVPKAFLSAGSVEACTMVLEKGWFVFASVQSMALRFAELTTDKVQLNTSRPEEITVTIPISELWGFLYDKLSYLYPQACNEAVRISAESVERPQQNSYEFTSKDSL